MPTSTSTAEVVGDYQSMAVSTFQTSAISRTPTQCNNPNSRLNKNNLSLSTAALQGVQNYDAGMTHYLLQNPNLMLHLNINVVFSFLLAVLRPWFFTFSFHRTCLFRLLPNIGLPQSTLHVYHLCSGLHFLIPFHDKCCNTSFGNFPP
jgi:hypothetical protein